MMDEEKKPIPSIQLFSPQRRVRIEHHLTRVTSLGATDDAQNSNNISRNQSRLTTKCDLT